MTLLSVGTIHAELDVHLRLDKPVYEVGEAIPATLILINHGSTDCLIQATTEPTGALDGWSFTVRDHTGQPVPRPDAKHKSANYIGSWQTIRPDEKCERAVFLNHWMPPLQPGDYTVTATYQLAGSPARQSAELKFHILPTTSTKLAVRIDRLTRQAEKGDTLAIDFLSFTGENEAIPPLLDAIYADDLRAQQRAATALSYIIDRLTVISNVVVRLKEHGSNPVIVEWLTLTGITSPEILPIYLKDATATNADARAGAFTGLRWQLETISANAPNADQIRQLMRRGLTDEDPRVRYEAVRALQRVPDRETIEIFQKLATSDTATRVREAAAIAVKNGE